MNLQGKTALITGGAHRIGGALTLMLAEAGANVVINYRSSDKAAQALADEARALGVGALPAQADVADYEQVAAMVAQAEARFGGGDILINSASWYKATPFPAEDVSLWQSVSRILMDGAFYCANAVAPGMLERGAGAILNIVDLSAWQPFAGYGAHSVGKAALLALTRQLAVELAPAVRVNAISPGPVLPPPGFTEEQTARVARGTLLKRWGAPQDVTQAARFLLEADYITGEVLMVDGGERYG